MSKFFSILFFIQFLSFSIFASNFDQILDNFLEADNKTPLLYPHQKTALEKYARFIQDGNSQGYFELATGSGKTLIQWVIALSFARYAQNIDTAKKSIAIVVPSIILTRQSAECLQKFSQKLEQLNLPIKNNLIFKISCKGTKAKNVPYCFTGKSQNSIFIFCINSFDKYIDICQQQNKNPLDKFGLIILDESHKIWARVKSYLNRENAQIQKTQLCGFSATPKRIQEIGQKIYCYTPEEAVKDKILVPWDIKKTKDLLLMSPQELAQKIKDKYLQLSKQGHKKLLIVVKSIKFAKKLEKELQNFMHVKAVHSKISQNTVFKTLDAFKDPEQILNNLIVIGMCQEGFDDPELSLAIVAKKVSLDTLKQIRGRLLRKNQNNHNKKALLVLDHEVVKEFLPLGIYLNI